MFQSGPTSPSFLYSVQFKKTQQHTRKKPHPKTEQENMMFSSQILQYKTKDRWWIKSSGESQPLTAPRNALESNTWKREGCTVDDRLLRGRHPPQPQWHQSVCAVLIHLQVWKDATQEFGECCFSRSHNPVRWFQQISSKMYTLQKIHKALSSLLWFKDGFHNNFLSDFQNYFLPEPVLCKGFFSIVWFKQHFCKKIKCCSSLRSCRSLIENCTICMHLFRLKNN